MACSLVCVVPSAVFAQTAPVVPGAAGEAVITIAQPKGADEFRRETWRDALKSQGVKGASQDAVIEFADQEETALQPLRQQARALAQAVASKEVSDAQIAAMLDSLRANLRAEREHRVVALANLKAQTNYDGDIALETPLVFFGLVGEEAGVLDAVPQALERLDVKTVPAALKKLNVEEADGATILRFVTWQEDLYKKFIYWASDDQSRVPLQTLAIRQTALGELREGTAERRAISDRGLKKLDAKLNYSGKPRLEAQLFLLGLLGDESSVLDGFNWRGRFQFRRFKDVVTGENIKNDPLPH